MVKVYQQDTYNYYPDEPSASYREGLRAYRSWLNSGNRRPENPYWFGLDESRDYLEWERGWLDGSFEI